MSKKVVLAYSGGLDTSVAIPWLGDQDYEVIAVAVDVGQPTDLSSSVARAKVLGAAGAHLVDARAEYVKSFVLPSLRMNALYQGRYPLVSALSRPLISRVLVDIARSSGADAIAHGCTGKGNDQVRFEVSLSALASDMEVLAPVRDWDMSREQTIAYAQRRRLPVATTKSSPYSIDANLWGRSIECGVLEDPWTSPPEEVFELTTNPEEVTGTLDVEVSFERGVPVAVDGERLEPAQVIAALGKIAGSYGYGRVDLVEDRLVGIKSREIYEAPAALALITAHRDLEALTLERNFARAKRTLEQTWTELVYEGLWYTPLREGLDAFAASCEAAVTGDVKLRMAAASCLPAGRRSPLSLYDRALATYDDADAFQHGDAAGFVKLWGLPARRWSKVHS